MMTTTEQTKNERFLMLRGTAMSQTSELTSELKYARDCYRDFIKQSTEFQEAKTTAQQKILDQIPELSSADLLYVHEEHEIVIFRVNRHSLEHMLPNASITEGCTAGDLVCLKKNRIHWTVENMYPMPTRSCDVSADGNRALLEVKSIRAQAATFYIDALNHSCYEFRRDLQGPTTSATSTRSPATINNGMILFTHDTESLQDVRPQAIPALLRNSRKISAVKLNLPKVITWLPKSSRLKLITRSLSKTASLNERRMLERRFLLIRGMKQAEDGTLLKSIYDKKKRRILTTAEKINNDIEYLEMTALHEGQIARRIQDTADTSQYVSKLSYISVTGAENLRTTQGFLENLLNKHNFQLFHTEDGEQTHLLPFLQSNESSTTPLFDRLRMICKDSTKIEERQCLRSELQQIQELFKTLGMTTTSQQKRGIERLIQRVGLESFIELEPEMRSLFLQLSTTKSDKAASKLDEIIQTRTSKLRV
jgi:hypothetical protein